jgi:hypothetical protein
MNSLNFPDTLTNYPLTIEGVKLLQDAITLAASGALTGGSSEGCYIVSGCTIKGTSGSYNILSQGTLLVHGELFRIEDGTVQQPYLQITEDYETITVGVDPYKNARKIRTATFAETPYGTNYEWATFTRITTNVDLYKLITTNVDASPVSTTNYLVPRGAIIMWYGTTPPDGWALCDGTNGPDLRNKFIVGYGSGYYLGQTGGEPKTTKVINHKHSYMSDDVLEYCGGLTAYKMEDLNQGSAFPDKPSIWGNFESGKSHELGYYGTSTPLHPTGGHFDEISELENRPPFFALAYIIKL